MSVQPKRTIEVKYDPSRHPSPPENELEALSWAALDTAWNLLREYSVRSILASMRHVATEQGLRWPETDEQMFAEAVATGDPDAPKDHLDLAPDCPGAALMLSQVFQHLVQEAGEDANQGIAAHEQGIREIAEMTDNGDVHALLKDLAESGVEVRVVNPDDLPGQEG